MAESEHAAKIDAFREEHAQQISHPEVNKLVQLEREIFQAERDPAREAPMEEKVDLLQTAIMAKVDLNGDLAVDVSGDDSEVASLDRDYEWRHADLSKDGLVDTAELRASIQDRGKYVLDDDDTFMTDSYYDANQDGLIDVGKKYQTSVPANGTNYIYDLFTRVEK
jgi:hypothetical protein